MYIPYEEIFNAFSCLFPDNLSKKIKSTGYNLKIEQNLNYIKKNRVKVLKRVKEKFKKEKLIVAFHIYDDNKWKAQSLYDLFLNSDKFVPYIFATKNCSLEGNMNYQTQKDVDKTYNFFKAKNMNVLKAYQNDNFIPFDKMPVKPDIIIYCQPWYNYKTQGPVMTSKYALNGYIPYGIPNSISPIEYYTRFHLYVQRLYVLDEMIRKHYASNMKNKGINLVTVGHTILDYYYLNQNKEIKKEDYVIYAPHWSVDDNNNLHWGTFLELGDKVLEFAKAHPEIKWVYKPHPCLEDYLKTYKTQDEITSYKKEWAKIGLVCESGDYFDIFLKSKAMISDCGSFQTEYFLTKNPFIHLQSKNPTPFNSFVQRINDTYYKVKTADELNKTLTEVLINNNDSKKEERIKLYNELNMQNNYAAKNIYDDILAILKD